MESFGIILVVWAFKSNSISNNYAFSHRVRSAHVSLKSASIISQVANLAITRTWPRYHIDFHRKFFPPPIVGNKIVIRRAFNYGKIAVANNEFQTGNLNSIFSNQKWLDIWLRQAQSKDFQSVIIYECLQIYRYSQQLKYELPSHYSGPPVWLWRNINLRLTKLEVHKTILMAYRYNWFHHPWSYYHPRSFSPQLGQ